MPRSPPPRHVQYADPGVPPEPLHRSSHAYPASVPAVAGCPEPPTLRVAHDLPAPQERQRRSEHHRLREIGTYPHTAGPQSAPAHTEYASGVAVSPGIVAHPALSGSLRHSTELSPLSTRRQGAPRS